MKGPEDEAQSDSFSQRAHRNTLNSTVRWAMAVVPGPPAVTEGRDPPWLVPS